MPFSICLSALRARRATSPNAPDKTRFAVTKATAVAALVSVVLSASPALAIRDHLQCFRIKDAIAKGTYTADLTTATAVIPPLEPGCTIRMPARLFCIDAGAQNVNPTPPGGPSGLPGQSYLCYRAKCNLVKTNLNATDQFGTHPIDVLTTTLVCAPIQAPTVCGNGLCESGEDSSNCPEDCVSGVCGDGLCEPGEDSSNCPEDCVSFCGNGICDGGEDANNCPLDCPSTCGNGVCEPGEDSNNCSGDCPAGSPDGCTAAIGPGCNDCSCEAAVCSFDPWCCDTAWDDFCVQECEATGQVCPARATPFCQGESFAPMCGGGDCSWVDPTAQCVDLGGGYCWPSGTGCSQDSDCAGEPLVQVCITCGCAVPQP